MLAQHGLDEFRRSTRSRDKLKAWKYDWEPQYLEARRDFIFRNTFKDIEYILKHLGEGCGTRFEFECYDVGHLYNLAHFLDRKLVKPPLFVQTIFGILGGIGADPEDLMHMRAHRGPAVRRRVRVVGPRAPAGTRWGSSRWRAIMGGNVRVGLEDSIYIGKGKLAKSNAEQVAKIRRILEELSLEIATPGGSAPASCAEGRRSASRSERRPRSLTRRSRWRRDTGIRGAAQSRDPAGRRRRTRTAPDRADALDEAHAEAGQRLAAPAGRADPAPCGQKPISIATPRSSACASDDRVDASADSVPSAIRAATTCRARSQPSRDSGAGARRDRRALDDLRDDAARSLPRSAAPRTPSHHTISARFVNDGSRRRSNGTTSIRVKPSEASGGSSSR